MSDSPNPLAELRAALEKAQAAEMAFWASGSDATERVQDAAWSVVYTALAAAEAEREGMREALEYLSGMFAEFRQFGMTGPDLTRVEAAVRRALNSEPSDETR